MDVVWGETAGVEGQLLLLCPLLFLLQVLFLIFVSNILEELLKNFHLSSHILLSSKC
jgi:hypothetical protein